MILIYSVTILGIIAIICIIVMTTPIKQENLMIRSSRTPTAVQKKLLTKPWPCPTCVSGQSLLPIYQYTLSDARCVKSKRQTLILQKSEIDSLSAYTSLPDDNRLASCVTEYNSMYSSVVGRYIRLYSLDSSDFILNHMSVYDKLGTLISQPTNVIYCSSTAANSYNVDIILNSVSTISADFTSNGGYIQLDLLSNMTIGYIKLSQKPVSTIIPQTLAGKWVMVLKDLNTNTVITNPLIVFNYQIGTITSQMTVIYTQNVATSNTYPTITDPFETFPDPCTNCTTTSGTLLKGYKYNKNISGKTYCFKAKESNINSSSFLNTSAFLSDYESNIASFIPCTIDGKFPNFPLIAWKIDASDALNIEYSGTLMLYISAVNEFGTAIHTFIPHDMTTNVTTFDEQCTYITTPSIAIRTVSSTIRLRSNDLIEVANMTFYIVGRHISGSESQVTRIFARSLPDTSTNTFIDILEHNEIDTNVCGSTTLNVVTDALLGQVFSTSNLHIMTFNYQSNIQTIFLNGVQVSRTTSAITWANSTTNFNTLLHNNYELSEMRAYRGSTTQVQMTRIITELKDKWSITQW